jgi:hypothetical protein
VPRRSTRDRLPPGQVCYLCSVEPATTLAHVPAQGFFPTDHSQRGIPLPACAPCNQKYSRHEAYAQELFQLACDTPEANAAFENRLSDWKRSGRQARERRILLPKSRADQLKDRISTGPVKTPGGIVLGRGQTLSIDDRRVKIVLVKIVQGLYYMTFGEVIPSAFRITTSFPPEDILEDQLRFRPRVADSMGNVFAYRCNVYDNEKSSVWWLWFYRTIVVPVLLEGPEQQKEHRSENGIILEP